MAASKRVPVEVQDDFLARQTKAKPVGAIAELIWNSLDADASSVKVDLVRQDLAGGLSKIVVLDTGDGFSHADAASMFGKLGGSWKRLQRQTHGKKRLVHGQEGRGRYKALALGRTVNWKVCYAQSGKTFAFEIAMRDGDLKGVEISEPVEVTGRKTGVLVEIEDLLRDFSSLSSDEGIQELTETFALYLMNYRDVDIEIDGRSLDPMKAILDQKEYALSEIFDASGATHKVVVKLIEWTSPTNRILYLCGESGFPLDQLTPRFYFNSYQFSAYICSSYVRALHDAGQLGLAEMDGRLLGIVEEARQTIKAHFRARDAEKAKTVVEQWKDEQIYPYQGEAATPIEHVERQVFDIVAVSLQAFSPDLEQAPAKSRALHLRMLRNAIENSPEELQLILTQVLDLPIAKQKELADLLQETTLSSIITAAKVVADRLKFITGLETIVFDPEHKEKLKERSQLHQILAANTWVFGEEYNLWVSDGDLKRVLEKHRAVLDPSIRIDEPVKVVGQKRGIIDLMFSRAVRNHKPDDKEHMIVELKAPKVKIGPDEITQIMKYQHAVTSDERFNTVPGLRWHFWIVSNELTEYAKNIIKGVDPRRRLIHRSENVSVGIKTWGEIIEENRGRLQFFQEHLQHTADQDESLKYLKERHAEFLAGVVIEEDNGETAGEDAAGEKKPKDKTLKGS